MFAEPTALTVRPRKFLLTTLCAEIVFDRRLRGMRHAACVGTPSDSHRAFTRGRRGPRHHAERTAWLGSAVAFGRAPTLQSRLQFGAAPSPCAQTPTAGGSPRAASGDERFRARQGPLRRTDEWPAPARGGWLPPSRKSCRLCKSAYSVRLWGEKLGKQVTAAVKPALWSCKKGERQYAQPGQLSFYSGRLGRDEDREYLFIRAWIAGCFCSNNRRIPANSMGPRPLPSHACGIPLREGLWILAQQHGAPEVLD
ncbi:hypothetical protein ON010_g1300 [Phytophthora cinnamomi]|nr:hypothetical protein ON010_g1300 [Phytophthora cinnamomi]